MTDVAIETANKIMRAVEKKLVKYKGHTRKIEVNDEYAFYEIAMRPPGGSPSDDLTVAYSAAFFAEATPETLRPKAVRVYNDFRTLLGLPRE